MQWNDNDQRLSELEEKWMNGTISPAEAREYADWYNHGQDATVEVPQFFASSQDEHRKRILQYVNTHKEPAVSSFPKKIRYAVAASVIVALLGCACWYFLPGNQKVYPVAKIQNPSYRNDVMPAETKATLTFEGGKTIVLDKSSEGLLATLGNAEIMNLKGSLVYRVLPNSKRSFIYNTLVTHKGEQYALTLADGTRVRLNAASSIRFPVAFSGNDRVVEITGEAYFEVAHNPLKPFKVKFNGGEVEVLGTHFNVNAYEDEVVVKTTLMEGSVKVNHAVVLTPGQQSQCRKDGNVKVIDNVDVVQEVAWKDGFFNFNSCDIETIMRQVEKWYDIKVVYAGHKTEDLFTGSVSRHVNLTELLEILKLSRVHFKLEGRTLTVLP